MDEPVVLQGLFALCAWVLDIIFFPNLLRKLLLGLLLSEDCLLINEKKEAELGMYFFLIN